MIIKKNALVTEIKENMRGGNGAPDQSYHTIDNTGTEELVFMALILNASV